MKEITVNSRDFKESENISLQNEMGGVWVNTVFNVTREGSLPVRFLRGFLPAFKLAESIRETSEGKTDPTIRIFQPLHFTTSIDGINPEVASRQQLLGTSAIFRMADRHFPSVKVMFETDQKITDAAMSILSDVATLIDPSQNSELFNRFRESGQKWGGMSGAEKSLLYVAHHPFGWSNLHHLSFFENCPPDNVINILPPSEKRFTQVRREIMSKVDGTPMADLATGNNQIDLSLNICGAHYIPLRDETGKLLEPELDNIENMSGKDALDQMQDTVNNLRSGSLKSNAKKALMDIQILIEELSEGSPEGQENISLSELIGGKI